MPIRKSYRRKAPFRKRKRFVRRKYPRKVNPRASLTTVNIPTGKSPFPDRMLAVLKYSDENPTSALFPDVNLYRLNSIFDPDLSGGGHQPYGRDQYATLYQRYRVWKVRVVYHSSTISTTPNRLTVVVNDDTTNFTSTVEAMERPGSSNHILNLERPTVFSKVIYPNKIFGMTPIGYKSDITTSATMGSNPTFGDVVLHNVHASHAGSTNAGTVINPTIYFHVEFFDPVEFGQS